MNTSEQINEIAKALAEFNKEITRISKDASNPFHKNQYATLDNILDTIRPILSKNGLSIMQLPSGDGQTIEMRTLLIHTSGQFIESPIMTMRATKNDAQALGSLITYAKRYQIGAILGLSTGDVDDDGNSASQIGVVQETINRANQNVSQNHRINISEEDLPFGTEETKLLSAKQLNMIKGKLNGLMQKHNTSREKLLQKANITKEIEHLTPQEASKFIDQLFSWEKA